MMMTASECIACGLKHPFVFNVRHRGIYRRFCTACVLKNHSGCFCPICFEVFDFSKPLPTHQRLTCFNCPSVSHLACVNPPASTRYRCPSCSDSNFSFFDLSDKSSDKSKKFRTNNGAFHQTKTFNKYLAKQLLAAAKIAASTMAAAAVSAMNEAEKKVEEAAVTRKRARDAMEELAQRTTGDLQMFDLENFGIGIPSLLLNRVQNQSQANGSALPSWINEVSLQETAMNETNELLSLLNGH